MVFNGYIANKEKVLLHDSKHGTYVYAIVERTIRADERKKESYEDIINNIYNGSDCKGIEDVLTIGDEKNFGYYFEEPKMFSSKKKNNKMYVTSGRIMTFTEFNTHVLGLITPFFLEQNMAAEKRKQSFASSCRKPCGPNDEIQPTKKQITPTIIISAPDWGLEPPRSKRD